MKIGNANIVIFIFLSKCSAKNLRKTPLYYSILYYM
nr:MAG TPA: hypothetical protein [Caudoviricetes sp.]